MAIPSKYPQTVAFSAAHPLPKSARGLADAILDVATILVACRGGESKHWSRLSLDIIHQDESNPYPGAFLSNPAMLANTRMEGAHGTSLGSLTAGCFFSYSHYQEDSLGTALLLAAFSPRTRKPKRSARLYAQALALLVESGEASGALLRMASVEGADLASLAAGRIAPEPGGRADLEVEFDAMAIAGLGALRTDLAAKAVELALSDDKRGLFGEDAREKLRGLVQARAAFREALAIGESAAANPARRGPRARV